MPLDPIAKMACYCCGVRMLDAQSARPVCDDRLAERFMDAEARAVFAPFRKFGRANVANAVRHRMIDDLLRARLAADERLQVVLLGAGFDTRAFRLGGGRWLEIDAPGVIAAKDAKLPARQAPNPLTRVSIDFDRERLSDTLAAWADARRRTVVVLEGVTMYLREAQLRSTARELHAALPGHALVADLMDGPFVRLYSAPIRAQIRRLGGEFAPPQEDPVGFFASLGYRPMSAESIAERSATLGVLPLPKLLLRTALKSLRDGYRIVAFESAKA